MHQIAINHLLHQLFPNTVNIQSIPAAKMNQRTPQNRWTRCIDAASNGLPLFPNHRLFAFGTATRHLEKLSILGAKFRQNSHNFWYNFPSFSDNYSIANVQVQTGKSIAIMREARETIVPANCTGLSSATGVRAPVLPTCTVTASTIVGTSAAGYFRAIAQRGNL